MYDIFLYTHSYSFSFFQPFLFLPVFLFGSFKKYLQSDHTPYIAAFNNPVSGPSPIRGKNIFLIPF